MGVVSLALFVHLHDLRVDVFIDFGGWVQSFAADLEIVAGQFEFDRFDFDGEL